MSNLSIKKQFQIILGCMAALSLILSVVSYTALDRLLLKNAAAYARNTSQKFDGEMHYLFQRIDSIFNTLLFDWNIEGLLHTPYSSKIPEICERTAGSIYFLFHHEPGYQRHRPDFSGYVLVQSV